ncbi:UDP-N-acetylmuramoyl-tripeptide--D-alanyl-D-alanine ligase [Candidatus Nitrospira bockiana]
MALFSLAEILDITGARPLIGELRARRGEVHRVSTDSRDIRPGDLFVAFRGERFDGHQFVEPAVRAGAVAALVDTAYQPSAGLRDRRDALVLSVPDTVLAYQRLATFHRRRFDIPVVAVTGSNGKTTTKEMVARVLEERWAVLVTEGNLNNRIGVPHTVLRLTASHEAAVIEMGVDQKGQTTRLAQIARPTIGLVTNVGPDHLEFFGTMDVSAEAKAELLEWLGPEDAAVLNADDRYHDYLASRARCRLLSFGTVPQAEVRADEIRSDAAGTSFRLQVPGQLPPARVALSVYGAHNISNALAAAAVGTLCGLSGGAIARGLARFKPASMRSQVESVNGMTVINDCYNANPASMMAALDLLAAIPGTGRRVAVLGDMLELGARSPAFHEEVGAYTAGKHIDFLLACGALGRGIAEGARRAGMPESRVREADDARTGARMLRAIVQPGDVVLVKGSRGMRMEHVIDDLRAGLTAVDQGGKQTTAKT